MTKLLSANKAAFGAAWNYPGWKWLVFWMAVVSFASWGRAVTL